MNLLINILKAFGITVGFYLLLLIGTVLTIYLIDCLHHGFRPLNIFFGNFGLKRESTPAKLTHTFLPLFLLFSVFALALIALYLPSQAQMYMIFGAGVILLGIYCYVGFQFVIMSTR